MTIDVCIRGAGIVGKALALLLARQRLRVGLVQGPIRAEPDIRAFALNAASKALLESLRAWPVSDLANGTARVAIHDTPGANAHHTPSDTTGCCPVQHMRVHGDDGGMVQFDAPSRGATRSDSTENSALAWIVDAAALDARLTAALGFAPEVQWLPEAQNCPLTVVCEGKMSATRAAFGVEFEQFAYQQTAIAAHIDTELPHQHTAWQWMGGQGEVCALLPRGASMPGNSVALVWSVSDVHAAQLQLLDPAAFTAALQAASGNTLGTMRLTSPIATWPLHIAQAMRWVGTTDHNAGWALAGDAAHSVHPLAGQGLNLGLADVSELARVLAGKEYFRSLGDMRLLRRYERARKGDAGALRLATDGLHSLFAADDARLRLLRNWGMSGFERLAPLKAAVMHRAMGLA